MTQPIRESRPEEQEEEETTTTTPPSPSSQPLRSAGERREERRHFRHFWNLIFGGLRAARARGRNFSEALGLFLVAGATVAIAGTAAFAFFAGHVRSGATQRFDEAVLQYLGTQRSPAMERFMLEVTYLGTAVTVITIVAVAGLFLFLTNHRYSALLLAVSTVGGIILNNILKVSFDRPRPRVIDWGQEAMSSSFPSGHAMSAAIVYFTVAYLAARLEPHRVLRALTMVIALVLVFLICVSRMYLGVHYPSDVAAGVLIGLAWAGFCMATLEAVQKFALGSRPSLQNEEQPAPEAG